MRQFGKWALLVALCLCVGCAANATSKASLEESVAGVYIGTIAPDYGYTKMRAESGEFAVHSDGTVAYWLGWQDLEGVWHWSERIIDEYYIVLLPYACNVCIVRE